MSNCRSGCPTQDHASWGECARSARLQVGWCRSTFLLDKTRDKAHDRELALYREARDAGIQPDGTTTGKVRFAMDQSEKHGMRYGEEFNVVPRLDRKGYDAVSKKQIAEVGALLGASDREAVMTAGRGLGEE